MKDLIAGDPRNPELYLALGHVAHELGKETSKGEKYFTKALHLFSAENNLSGEVRTRVALWTLYREKDQAKADQELITLLGLRKHSTDVELLARIDIAHARSLFDQHNDFVRARELLTPYADYIAGDAPFILKYRYLFTLGRVVLELGMAEESFNYFIRAADLAKQHGRPAHHSTALGNALSALRDQLDEFSDEEKREAAVRFAQRVLENARETGSLVSELKALITLAELSRDPERASALYSECAALASKELGDRDILVVYKTCRLALAEQVALHNPEAARKIVDDLWIKVPFDPNFLENAYDKHGEMRVLWNTGSSEEAWAATVDVLSAIEEVRDAQLERDGRSRSFSAWAMTYPWLAGRLLNEPSRTRSDLGLQRAFKVIETMRARLLLDLLEAMQVQRRETPELRLKRKKRLDLIEQRNRLQHDLRVAAIDEKKRTEITARLDRLQDDEKRLRAEIARESGVFADLEQPQFASVLEVQRLLAPSEALLSFHLAPWETAIEPFAGGSWLVVLTATSASAYKLPSEKEIEQRVSIFTGLLERREDDIKSGSGLASRLYQDLLAEAFEDLPAEVTDLIVIPDKALYRLPFAALRPTKDAPPLATRYRFSRVPSATLWLRRWREPGPPSVAPRPALVLADPGTFESEDAEADGSQVASLMREGDLFRAESYGPLPFARQEGWSLLRQLGPGTEVLTGFEASERFLRTAENLDRFGILHFAAHAVANEEEPDRAGIFLAPDLPDNGTPVELDGVLQFNEIVDLGFNDRTVVLSTCHSARGQILRGEGVFDLARAFFEGGARAVVGSLWRLEDKATAEFFDDFYRHLARGVSLSEALHRAQNDQIRRGAPPSVWAGIVVIGDGSLVPVPSLEGRHHPFWPIAFAVVLLLVAVAVAARRNP